MGEKRRLHQLFFRVNLQDFAFLIDQRFDKGDQVARIKLRGAGRDAARHVEIADNLDAIHVGNFTGNSAFDIAAALNRQIDQHRTRAHGSDHFLRHQTRGRTARNKRRGDDDILLGDMVGNECCLFGLIVLRHFLGIAAGGFRRLELVVLDRDELRAKRGNLFLRRRANIGGGHDCTQTARGRNRLKTGNARPHDENLGGGNRARCRHHHRHGAVIDFRRIDHRLITGKIGLRRQNVHHLRAGYARHEFHRKSRNSSPGKSRHRIFMAIGVQHGEKCCARFIRFQFRIARTANFQDDIRRFGIHRRADAGTGCRKFGIGNARFLACAFFHHDIKTKRDEFLHRLRRPRNTGFVGVTLFRDI